MTDGRLVICVDVDGVLANFIGAWAAWEWERGKKADPRPTSWCTEPSIDEFIATPGSYEGLESLISMWEWAGLDCLMAEHYVYFVTSRNTAGEQVSTCQAQTARWLSQWLHAPPSVIVAGRSRGKLPILAALGADFYIDDNIDSCRKALPTVPNVFVMAQSWNKAERGEFKKYGGKVANTFMDFVDAARKVKWTPEAV